MDEETYTPPEAARILRLSRQRVTQMLNAGELEGSQDPETGRWKIPQRAVHERLKDRPAKLLRGRLDDRGLQSFEEAPENVTELQARLEDLSYRLGRSEARVELTERTESTIREERDRLLAELEEERAERRRLQAELDEARKPWWRRMFGG